MTQQKLSTIQWYHARTPLWEMPPWVYGLRSVMMNKRYLSDLHLPWDYGLSATAIIYAAVVAVLLEAGDVGAPGGSEKALSMFVR